MFAYLRSDDGDNATFVHISMKKDGRIGLVYYTSWIDDDVILAPILNSWIDKVNQSKIEVVKKLEKPDHHLTTGRIYLQKECVENLFGKDACMNVPSTMKGVIKVIISRRQKLMEIEMLLSKTDMRNIDVSKTNILSEDPRKETLFPTLSCFNFNHIV